MLRPANLLISALAATSLALGLAACGNDSSNGDAAGASTQAATPANPGSDATSNARPRAEAAGVRAAQAEGAKVEVPEGKKIAFLTLVGAVETTKRMERAAQAAAKKLGWKVLVYDAGGDIKKVATSITAALNQGADAILSVAITPALMTQGLRAAQARGIPVINISNAVDPSPYLAASYVQDYTQGVTLLAEEMTKQVPDSSKIGIFQTPLLKGYVPAVKAMETAAQRHSWDIVGKSDVDLTDINGAVRRATGDFLSSHPDAKALFVDLAPGFPVAAQVLKQRRKCGKVLLYSDHDDLLNQKSLREGCGAAVASYPVEVVSWEAMDQLAEHIARNRKLSDFPKATADLMKVYGIDLQEPQVLTKVNLPPEGRYPPAKADFLAFFNAKWKAGFGIAPS